MDFQNCTYTSPASDLIHFFNTSITDDMLLEHENYLLEEYRKTLVTEMAKLGCRTQPITMNELKAALVRKAFMGMFATFMVLPYILVDKDAICSTTEILSNDGKINVPGVHNKLYRAALVRRLKVFDQLGLLDWNYCNKLRILFCQRLNLYSLSSFEFYQKIWENLKNFINK